MREPSNLSSISNRLNLDSRKIRWDASSGGWQEQRCRGVRIQEAFWEEGRTRAERSRIDELKLNWNQGL